MMKGKKAKGKWNFVVKKNLNLKTIKNVKSPQKINIVNYLEKKWIDVDSL